MGKITNTSKQDPMLHVADALFGGSSGAIERSEARGQSELVNSSQLPTDNRDKETMEKWGINFGPPCEGDEIFCDAELPEGWKIQPTGHSMWSELLDEKGRVRASIFYKAAFYDRSAHMRAERRFQVCKDFEVPDGQIKFDVKCDGNLLHSELRTFEGEKYSDNWYASDDECRSACETWLVENYPKHADPIESWNIEV